MRSLRLNVIVGSTRPTRAGFPVAEWLTEFAKAHGSFDVSLVDLAELKLPILDEEEHPRRGRYCHEHTRSWSGSVAKADAFVFVTPEYDFFPPASLINAIQCLYQEWQYKAAGILSYGGISGGLRAAQSLRLLLCNVGVMPMVQTVPIPYFSRNIINGAFLPADGTTATATTMLDELFRWSNVLTSLRGTDVDIRPSRNDTAR